MANLDFITISPPIPESPAKFADTGLAIKQATDRLAYLELLSQKLDSLLVQILERKKEYEAHIPRLHAETLHININDLPVEVLNNIFCQYLAGPNPHSRQLNSLDYDQRPWILSWVCSYWRNAILADVQIWSSIPRVNLTFPEGYKYYDLRILQEYMFRSQSHPLSIHLHQYCPNFQDPPYTLLPCLFRDPSRIKDLTLNVELEHMQRLFCQYPAILYLPRGLESLTTLSLLSTVDQFEDEGGPFPSFLRNLPALRELRCAVSSSTQIFQSLFNLPFPWEQLTSLTIFPTKFGSPWNTSDLNSLCNILSMACQLQSLRLTESATTWNPDGISSSKHIVSSRIELLHIIACPMSTNYILGSLILPNLADLNIRISETTPHVLQSLLSRSGCSLTKCCFQDTRFPLAPTVLADVLQLLPQIRTLEIMGLSENSRFQVFSKPHNGVWLVPQLEHLFIASIRVSDPSVVEAVVRARSSGSQVTPIQTLCLRGALVAKEGRIKVTVPFFDLSGDHSKLFTNGGSGHSFLFYMRSTGHCFIRLNEIRGYEVNVHALEELCHRIEAAPTFANVQINGHFTGRDDVVELVARLGHLLELLHDQPSAYSRIAQCKERILRVFRFSLSDPWPFQTPPAGWTRREHSEPTEDSGDVETYSELVYTANHSG